MSIPDVDSILQNIEADINWPVYADVFDHDLHFSISYDLYELPQLKENWLLGYGQRQCRN